MNPSPRNKKNLLPAAVLLLSALEGGVILALLFSQPSEAQNAVFMGFSRARLAIGAVVLGAALVLLAGGLLLLSPVRAGRVSWPGWKRASSPGHPLLAWFCGLLAAALAAVAWNEILATRLLRAGPTATDPDLAGADSAAGGAALALLFPAGAERGLAPGAASRGALPVDGAAAGGAAGGGAAHRHPLRHRPAPFPLFLRVSCWRGWPSWPGWAGCTAGAQARPWYASARSYLIAAVIFCLAFAVYRLSAVLVGNIVTPSKSYFDELARAWLQGRLYLTNPSDTHDLTLFNGQWYVANPPLVAILMIPLVWLFDDFNTVVYAAVNGALNAALMFLLLEWVARRGWTRLRTGGQLWLTAFFAFGTAHYYLSTIGRMWFMSQTITVTLLLLAASLAVTRRPAWLSGAALALAVVARPHILVFAPLLLGIAVQNAREDGRKFDFAAAWCAGDWRWACPILLAGAGLLFYNWLRFGDPLDYGYLTENVADFMAGDLQAYGTFHPVFILRNLRVMFLNLPVWRAACGWLAPERGRH